jgi:DNA-directed RNA polymerase subunit RPC12/RpoP
MGRVPITVMGFKCDRCGHEWVPRALEQEQEPKVCPGCKSAWWNKPRKTGITYEDFRDKIDGALKKATGELTWTEIRTETKLPQLFPNNQWVRRLEKDIGLARKKDSHGITRWTLKET